MVKLAQALKWQGEMIRFLVLKDRCSCGGPELSARCLRNPVFPRGCHVGPVGSEPLAALSRGLRVPVWLRHCLRVGSVHMSSQEDDSPPSTPPQGHQNISGMRGWNVRIDSYLWRCQKGNIAENQAWAADEQCRSRPWGHYLPGDPKCCLDLHICSY